MAKITDTPKAKEAVQQKLDAQRWAAFQAEQAAKEAKEAKYQQEDEILFSSLQRAQIARICRQELEAAQAEQAEKERKNSLDAFVDVLANQPVRVEIGEPVPTNYNRNLENITGVMGTLLGGAALIVAVVVPLLWVILR